MSEFKQLLLFEAQHIAKVGIPSTSINFSICEIFKIKPVSQFSELETDLLLFDEFLYQVQLPLESLYEWITIILFNVSAMNEEYIAQMNELAISQSQVDTIIINMLEQHSVLWLYKFISLPSIGKNIRKFHKCNQLTNLLQTIKYVAKKYQMKCPYQEQMMKKMEQESTPPYTTEINKIIFKSNILQLHKFLNGNFNCDLMAISRLIDANFYPLSTHRQLFKNAQITGFETIKQIAQMMIKSTEKKNLFGDKDHSRMLALFLVFIQHRYASVYLEWIHILQKLISSKQNIHSIMRSQIPKFFTNLSINHGQFSSILSHIYALLAEKQGKQASLQLMKKLFLNRIFLNPTLFLTYCYAPVDQKLLLQTLNKVRTIFYRKKISEQLKQVNEVCQQKFINFIKSKHTSERKNLYLLDHILYEDYHRIHSDLQSKSHLSDEYSLSFSFVRNSKDYSMKRDEKKPNENQTLNQIVQDMKSPPKSPSLGSAKHKTLKTEHTQLTSSRKQTQEIDQVDMLWELVQLRRKFGTNRRAIDAKAQQRRKRRQKWKRFMSESHYGFLQNKRQIEKSANFVKLQVEML